MVPDICYSSMYPKTCSLLPISEAQPAHIRIKNSFLARKEFHSIPFCVSTRPYNGGGGVTPSPREALYFKKYRFYIL
ncbi:hypothetical protein [Chlamydia vaughanii]|uniref:hypothetical protein n=1 Tax=Chlamydia vaughanii TaxID=3112552 RepID=UPI0032B16435